jgi:hypothetical protein
MRLYSTAFLLVIFSTVVCASYNSSYDAQYNAQDSDENCQIGSDATDAFDNYGCPLLCRGASIDGHGCVCPSCDIANPEIASVSIAATTITQSTAIVLQSAEITIDIGTSVFPSGDGEMQIRVHAHTVIIGIANSLVQASNVFTLMGDDPLANEVGITLKYDTALVYPGWIPFVYRLNEVSGLWEDVGISISHGDGTIYFETTSFTGQYVVFGSSKVGSLLPPRSFYGRVCVCAQGQEISMPCSSTTDVQCDLPRSVGVEPLHQFTVKVTLQGQDPLSIDEYLYRAALAQLTQVDFRDIAVSDVTVT